MFGVVPPAILALKLMDVFIRLLLKGPGIIENGYDFFVKCGSQYSVYSHAQLYTLWITLSQWWNPGVR